MALVLVFGIIIMAGLIVGGIYVLLKSRSEDLAAVTDHMSSQYICEAGASSAIIDIQQTGSTVMNKAVQFQVGNKTYPVSYTIGKQNGQWDINIQCPPYTMHLGGNPAFCIHCVGMME